LERFLRFLLPLFEEDRVKREEDRGDIGVGQRFQGRQVLAVIHQIAHHADGYFERTI